MERAHVRIERSGNASQNKTTCKSYWTSARINNKDSFLLWKTSLFFMTPASRLKLVGKARESTNILVTNYHRSNGPYQIVSPKNKAPLAGRVDLRNPAIQATERALVQLSEK